MLSWRAYNRTVCHIELDLTKAMKNVLVAEHMLRMRGMQKKPFIAGRSVHNQRIERLWRELWNGVNVTFYNVFYFMEDQEILQINSYEVDTQEDGLMEVNSVCVQDTPIIPEQIATSLEHILCRDSSCFKMDIFEDCLKCVQDSI